MMLAQHLLKRIPTTTVDDSGTNLFSAHHSLSENEDVQLFWLVHFAFKHHTQKGAVKIELNFLLCVLFFFHMLGVSSQTKRG